MSQTQNHELLKPGCDCVIKFLEEDEKYKHLINLYNTDRSASNKLRKSSIREFVQVDLLWNFIMMDIISDDENVSTLTDEEFTIWHTGVLDKEPTNLADHVADIIE